jgi:peroxiredoxin Q/BCP
MRLALFASALLVLPLGQDPAPKSEPAVPEVGKPAPAFRLNDDGGRAVAVGGKAAAWTVLAFFPKAATPG